VEDSQNRARTEATRAESARAFEQAWDLYDQQQADQVVDAFSNAGEPDDQGAIQSTGGQVADVTCEIGTPKPEELYKFLQKILHENGVDFFVAPYSAAAQVSVQKRASIHPKCRDPNHIVRL
jgi:hypothetical protein